MTDRADKGTGKRRNAISIDDFCDRNAISRASYYRLREAGTGPVEMRIGGMVRISLRAEREWIEKMERQMNAGPTIVEKVTEAEHRNPSEKSRRPPLHPRTFHMTAEERLIFLTDGLRHALKIKKKTPKKSKSAAI